MISYTTTPNPYDSAKELLAEDDHIEMDINVEGWFRSIRIRSLTIPQREKINRAAGTGKDRNWEAYYAETLVQGVVAPRLNPAMARELVAHHNGELIEQLGEAMEDRRVQTLNAASMATNDRISNTLPISKSRAAIVKPRRSPSSCTCPPLSRSPFSSNRPAIFVKAVLNGWNSKIRRIGSHRRTRGKPTARNSQLSRSPYRCLTAGEPYDRRCTAGRAWTGTADDTRRDRGYNGSHNTQGKRGAGGQR